MRVNVCCVFIKQKTAYEMRISDWSSDVCSSDLRGVGLPEMERRPALALQRDPNVFEQRKVGEHRGDLKRPHQPLTGDVGRTGPGDLQIGRPSCRERACQYV